MTAAMAILIPTIVKLLYGAWTGSPSIQLYGYELTPSIDAVHLTAGFMVWFTLSLVVWILWLVVHHPPKRLRRWAQRYKRRREEDKHVDLQQIEDQVTTMGANAVVFRVAGEEDDDPTEDQERAALFAVGETE